MVKIEIDDLSGPKVAALLSEHLAEMARFSPPESRHALDLEGLCHPDITFWCVWEGEDLLGCGALRQLNEEHVELKSMRTATRHQRKGVATHLLQHLLTEATQRGYRRISLETGAMAAFEPGRRLYAKFGFQPCPPFAGYRPDINSVFMTREL